MSAKWTGCRQPSFAHLRRLTDDTGLLEHALGKIPRRKEGYTADDNARALWTVTEWLALDTADSAAHRQLTTLAETYLGYLLWTQLGDGWWHNNFTYTRQPEQEIRSHDCQGRAFWACANAWVRLQSPLRETARTIVAQAMPTLAQIGSLRGQAFTLAACAQLLDGHAVGSIRLPDDLASELTCQLQRLEELMNNAYRHFTVEPWQWFEPAMTYGNGVLPWAMLRVYRYTRNTRTLQTGLNSFACLLSKMRTDEGWLRPIGNEGWCTQASLSRWDQQPLEVFKLALAAEEAARALEAAQLPSVPGVLAESGRSASQPTSPADYRDIRDLCREWFYGANDLQQPVADLTDGSCCDGLTRVGVNMNCGAESTLAYLMTEALCFPDQRAVTRYQDSCSATLID